MAIYEKLPANLHVWLADITDYSCGKTWGIDPFRTIVLESKILFFVWGEKDA